MTCTAVPLLSGARFFCARLCLVSVGILGEADELWPNEQTQGIFTFMMSLSEMLVYDVAYLDLLKRYQANAHIPLVHSCKKQLLLE